MRKVFLLGIFVIAMTGSSSAQLDSQISQSCAGDYEPVVSMAHPNKTINNIGTPGTFEYKVCVRGIIDVSFQNDCPGATSFFISSNSTHAHFSQDQGYNLGVCTEEMVTTLNETSCGPGYEPLFTVSDPINGFGRHIAGFADGKNYSNIVCAVESPPQNVTLGIKFNLSSSDEVYFDDQRLSGEFSDSSIAEFPYILSTDGDVVSGIVSNEYKKISREINGYNELKVRRDVDTANYYIPFTSGDHESVEDDQERFFEGGIENTLNPSFNMDLGGEPTVRAIAEQDAVIISNLSIGGGSHTIRIEKTGDNEITIEELR